MSSSTTLDKYADYVVVGGGIAGVSVALEIARSDLGSVLLLEAGFLGSGATAFSSGGVRQQFSTEREIDLSIRALEFWKSAQDEFGAPCVFTETGYLFVTAREEMSRKLGEAADLQRSMGAGPVEMLEARDIGEIVPWMQTDDLIGGCWTPLDGRIVPADGLAAIARAARSAGVQLLEHCPVEEIRRSHDAGFDLVGEQHIHASNVVVAAGLGTSGLLRPLGFGIEVRPWMIHYAYTAPALSQFQVPTTIDLEHGLTVKRDGVGLNVGVLDEASPMTSTAQDMLEDFFFAATHRAPSLVELEIVKTVSATADLSIDGHPYVGQLEDGLWVLAGFGGHGTMHAPVVAEDLVKVMAGVQGPEHLAPFDPKRELSEYGGEWLIASRKN